MTSTLWPSLPSPQTSNCFECFHRIEGTRSRTHVATRAHDRNLEAGGRLLDALAEAPLVVEREVSLTARVALGWKGISNATVTPAGSHSGVATCVYSSSKRGGCSRDRKILARDTINLETEIGS